MADPVGVDGVGPAVSDDAAAGYGPPDPSGTEAPRVRRRTRLAHSVRFRLTVAVVLVVGVSLLGGGLLLTRWVESTLTHDLRSRNERVLASMADILDSGNVPTELFSTPSELSGQINDQMSSSFAGRARDLEQVISTTYFYLDGQAFSQMK
ncbi:MAG TPA: hypothetical protein PK623_03800, partial [Microthrixaceae bacterium]|nr:hypothetical protein [Microthrixaceae bacterium]HNJ67684.1 hypothetical protein [Microthrixaceae bacterium]